MKCSYCGMENSRTDRYCSGCGTDLKKNAVVTYDSQKRLAVTITFLIPVMVFVTMFLVMNGVFSFLKKDTVTFGNDTIPTIAYVNSELQAISYSGNTDSSKKEHKYVYNLNDINTDEIDSYLSTLSAYGFYKVNDSETIFLYVSNSYDDGYVLEVSMKWYIEENNERAVITYIKKLGSIEDYDYVKPIFDDEVTKEIGGTTYGFIQIPVSWEKDSDNVMRYSSLMSDGVIDLAFAETDLSLLEYATEVENLYKDEDFETELNSTTFSTYDGYLLVVTSKKNPQLLAKVWFCKEDSIIHIISIVTYINDESVFKYIESYHL